MTHAARGAMRQMKNIAKGYTDIEQKVREATSNDPWGPNSTLMAEIADATYSPHEFLLIMKMIDKRMNDHGKNWRHVFKALTLLDYIIHMGSEQVVNYTKENLYIIKTLKEFQFIDEEGKDQGQNVRQKAKDMTALLSDEARLRDERSQRSTMRDRMTGRAYDEGGYIPSSSGTIKDRYPERMERAMTAQEERDLQRAIEESKRLAQEQEGRQKSQLSEEEQLRRAIELSKQEEEKRAQRHNKQNDMIDLFGSVDDGYANPYGQNAMPQQQQQSFDPFGMNPAGGYDSYGNNQQSYDPFGAPNQTYTQQSNPFGQPQRANNPFGGAGGGFGAPVQTMNTGGSVNSYGSGGYGVTNHVTGDNPNARLANIVKASQQIDPFTGMASGNRVASTPGSTMISTQNTGSTFNPFSSSTNTTQQPDLFAPVGNDMFSSQFPQTTPMSHSSSNPSTKPIVDLDNLMGPSQSSSSNMGTSVFGNSKNPFGSSGSSSGGANKQYDWASSGSKSNKSLNELAMQSQPTPMGSGGMQSTGGFGMGTGMGAGSGFGNAGMMGSGMQMGGMNGGMGRGSGMPPANNPFAANPGMMAQNNGGFGQNRGW